MYKSNTIHDSFNRDAKLHTYVKSKIKGGNRHELFSIFPIENQLFTENSKNKVRCNEPNGRMV